MKIGPIDTKPANVPLERKTAVASNMPTPAPGAAPASRPGAEASAQVALSSSAKLLATSDAEAGSFDGAKVERISQAIRDGKFVVNADAIADKLIVNAEELLGRRNS
jgi:negative regulator of flagellin synthesis FlgM